MALDCKDLIMPVQCNNGFAKVIRIKQFGSHDGLIYDDFVQSVQSFRNINDIEIPQQVFLPFIAEQCAHPSFVLKVHINCDDLTKEVPTNAEEIKSVNPENFQNHILECQNGDKLFNNYKEIQDLSRNDRRKVVSIAATYAQKHFGFSPTPVQTKAVARACIELFQCLKSSNGDELELLWSKNGKGFLQTKLKNDRVKRRRLELYFNKENTAGSDLQDEGVENYLEELKCLQLPQDEPRIKEILVSTQKYRKSQVYKSNQLHDVYNCFLKDPQLVIHRN